MKRHNYIICFLLSFSLLVTGLISCGPANDNDIDDSQSTEITVPKDDTSKEENSDIIPPNEDETPEIIPPVEDNEAPPSIPDTKINGMEIILHAGGAYDGLRLLNAQETFEYYYNLGYRYFEYDLRMSTDGHLIGTHSFEHLNGVYGNMSYEKFLKLKLDNGFTPVNEGWIIETIKKYPDVKFIIDAKADTTEGDTAVLARLEALEKIHGIDISSNIIPEIFSTEMWERVQSCTTFDKYLFSHYKVYYSIDKIIEDFSSDKIHGVAISTWSDNYIADNIYQVKENGKEIFLFTVTNQAEFDFAKRVNADVIYVDDPELVKTFK